MRLSKLKTTAFLLLLAVMQACSTGESGSVPLKSQDTDATAGVVLSSPWQSELANEHHHWMQKHWHEIELAAKEYKAVPSLEPADGGFDYTRLRQWFPLPDPAVDLIHDYNNGLYSGPHWESMHEAALLVEAAIRRGDDPLVFAKTLGSHAVAREFPQSWEILCSTWLVAVEQNSDLIGGLDNSAVAVDMIGGAIGGGPGLIAASAGYLLGHWLRETFF